MTAWWQSYADILPTFDPEEKKQIEDATGCIPLLLRELILLGLQKDWDRDWDDAKLKLVNCDETKKIFTRVLDSARQITGNGYEHQ